MTNLTSTLVSLETVVATMDSYAATEALYFTQLLNSNNVETAAKLRDERRTAAIAQLSQLQLTSKPADHTQSLAKALASLEKVVALYHRTAVGYHVQPSHTEAQTLATADRLLYELNIELYESRK